MIRMLEESFDVVFYTEKSKLEVDIDVVRRQLEHAYPQYQIDVQQGLRSEW